MNSETHWGFWEVVHWCGPSYEERRKRMFGAELHWDKDDRTVIVCDACGNRMNTKLLRDSYDRAVA